MIPATRQKMTDDLMQVALKLSADHEARIRLLESTHGSNVAFERHMAKSEQIWTNQETTNKRLEALCESTAQTLDQVVKKLWMIIGACSLAAASTGVLTWMLSQHG